MTEHELLLDVRRLKKYFRVEHGRQLHAVDDVSFQIRRGGDPGAIGESGCGKTTVGRTLLGLYEPDGGGSCFTDRIS